MSECRGGFRGGGAAGSDQQQNSRKNAACRSTIYNNTVVFGTQQQWKYVNDTIADWN